VEQWLSDFGCGFAALRCIAELHSAAPRQVPVRSNFRTPADSKSAIRQITNLRYQAAVPAKRIAKTGSKLANR